MSRLLIVPLLWGIACASVQSQRIREVSLVAVSFEAEEQVVVEKYPCVEKYLDDAICEDDNRKCEFTSNIYVIVERTELPCLVRVGIGRNQVDDCNFILNHFVSSMTMCDMNIGKGLSSECALLSHATGYDIQVRFESLYSTKSGGFSFPTWEVRATRDGDHLLADRLPEREYRIVVTPVGPDRGSPVSPPPRFAGIFKHRELHSIELLDWSRVIVDGCPLEKAEENIHE